MKSISIITVSFNAGDVIEETIKSVINQNFSNYEYLIVDGASTDETCNIVNKYIDRIDYFISEPDNGIYNAMNKAVSAAKGDYCIFMNAGDLFVNSLVLKQVSIFLDDGLDIYTGNEITLQEGKVIDYIIPPHKSEIKKHLLKTSISHQASFIKRTLLLEHPYDEELRLVSDWKFWIETIYLKNCSYKPIDVDVCYFNHEGITFKNQHQGINERNRVLNNLLGERFINHVKRSVVNRIRVKIKRRYADLHTKIVDKNKKVQNKIATQLAYVHVLKLKGFIPILCNLMQKGHVIEKTCVNLKHRIIKNFLIVSFSHVLQKVEKENSYVDNKHYIWVCWWQGDKEMPFLTKMCLKSIRQNCGAADVILISKENFSQYVDIPQHVLDLLMSKKISITNFSDILRFALLAKYGGLWVDSTCLITEPLDSILTYDFYSCKQNRFDDYKYVSKYRWASYFIGGKQNLLFKAMRDLFYEYTRQNSVFVDYLLLDYFIDLVYESSIEAKLLIDSLDNNNLGVLELQPLLDKEYNSTNFNETLNSSAVHKLTRKKTNFCFTKEGQLTNYGHLIKEFTN